MTTGGCLCGAVRFHISAEPVTGRTCWCRVCQYIGAGSATVNVVFPAAALSIEGELTDYVSVADSGSRMHRRFCPACGTSLFSASETRPDLVVVRVGALDDRESFAPAATIWTRSAPGWACIDPSLPQIEGQSPAPALPEKATPT
jgi:hypothetical protein